MDLRLGWEWRWLKKAVVAQNLAEKRHPEYASNGVTSSVLEVQRSVYGSATFRY